MLQSPTNKITHGQSPTNNLRLTLQLDFENTCILCNFSYISYILLSVDFFKMIFLKKSFRNTIGVEQFGSSFVGYDLGCFGRLTADEFY